MADKELVSKEVEVGKMVKPSFLTLTKLPANQVGFKIVRKDQKGTPVAKIQRQRATKRSNSTTLLAIQFGLETTDEEIAEFAEEYGLEDYKVVTEKDCKKIMRSDVTAIPANSISINLAGGKVAFIETTSKPAEEKAYIAVTRFDFEADYFETPDEIKAWCSTNGIDFAGGSLENTDVKSSVIVKRVDADEETRSIKVADGVVAVVVRAEEQAIPEAFVEVISETAYGNYGWGQLDFAAAMADVEFSEESREAIYLLEDVLRRILFYSPLPVSVRKELVTKAAADFATFIGTLLDALPARVIVAARSSMEKSMPKEAGSTQENQTTTPVQTPTATAAAQPESKTETPITRAEIEEIVAKAVATALTATRSEPQQAAAAPAPVAAAAPAADPAPQPAKDEVLEKVLRSMEALSTGVASIGERLGKMENSTVVRSDAGDSRQTAEKPEVFKGIFGGRQ